MRRIYVERRLYYFTCTGCGIQNRQTLKRKNARNLLCRKCRKNQVDPNQQSLFQFETQIKGKFIDEPIKSEKNTSAIPKRNERDSAKVFA